MSESIWFDIAENKMNLDVLIQKLETPENGAQVIFIGTVRSSNDGKKVLAVSYDVHEVLAKKCFNEICIEANQLGQVTQDPLYIVLCHRKGTLKVGEASIFIGVSSPHRAEAYEASRYVIEQIKQRAPIWKKEHYENGETEWLQGHALC